MSDRDDARRRMLVDALEAWTDTLDDGPMEDMWVGAFRAWWKRAIVEPYDAGMSVEQLVTVLDDPRLTVDFERRAEWPLFATAIRRVLTTEHLTMFDLVECVPRARHEVLGWILGETTALDILPLTRDRRWVWERIRERADRELDDLDRSDT